MVSALDSGSNGPGSNTGRGTAIVPLSTQVYRWVPAGGNPAID